jgi:tetratricopeptide (TPR) repeat protein
VDERVSTRKMVSVLRSGADEVVANRVGALLERAGLAWSADRVTDGSRLLVLLSPALVASQRCAGELAAMLSGDYLNAAGRVSVIRVAAVEPSPLFAALGYWDAVPVLDDDEMLGRLVVAAAYDGIRALPPALRAYRRPPAPLMNPAEVREVPNFLGRSDDLISLETTLHQTDIVAICGLGGMGKTTLARQYAWQQRDQYSVIWWLSAESESSIVDGLLALGATFIPGHDKRTDRLAAAQQVTASMLSGLAKPALLVFDGLEDERLLDPWLPIKGKVIITSRNAVWRSNIATVSLLPLSVADAELVLQHTTRRRDLTGPVVKEIAQLLDGLPLALVHAALYLNDVNTVSAQDFVHRFTAMLAEVPRGAEYPRAVFVVMRELIAKAEAQAPGAAAMVCLAGFLAPTPIPALLFRGPPDVYFDVLRPPASVSGIVPLDLRSTVAEPERVVRALESLNRYSLVTYAYETDSFDVHRLLQAAARDMVAETAPAWIRGAVEIVEAAFPSGEFDTWRLCADLLPHVRSVLVSSQRGEDTPATARLAHRCGTYLMQRAAYGEAEPLLRRALAENRARYGVNSLAVLHNLTSLAALLAETNRTGEAEPLVEDALAIGTRHYGADSPQITHILDVLAQTLYFKNQLREALEVYRRELAIDTAHHGAQHPAVAADLRRIAEILAETGDAEEAEQLFSRSLEIERFRHGENDPRTAGALHGLAHLLAVSKRFREAEAIYRELIPLLENAIGPEHPDLAAVLCDFAHMLVDTSRTEEAKPLLERAMLMYETTYGADHPYVAVTLTNAGRLAVAEGRFEDAEAAFRRALEIDESSFGPSHTEVAVDLTLYGNLLIDLGRYDEAEGLLRRAREISDTAYGPNNPDVSDTLNALGRLLLRSRRFAEADPLIRRAIRIDEAGGTAGRHRLARDLDALGELLASTGRAVEAEPHLLRALELTEEMYGTEDPKLAPILVNLATAYEKTHRSSEADAARSRARVLARNTVPDIVPRPADAERRAVAEWPRAAEPPVVPALRPAPPDIKVTIKPGDGGTLHWSFTTPHLPRALLREETPIIASIGTRSQVMSERIVSNFRAKPFGALDYLLGTGKSIAEHVPAYFWALIETLVMKCGVERPSVLLVTGEPNVPWELAVMPKRLDDAAPPFLGAQLDVGRWVLPSETFSAGEPPERSAFTSFAAVVADYRESDAAVLYFAEEEANALVAKYRAAKLSVSSFHQTKSALCSDFGILHFALHGQYDVRDEAGAIRLPDGQRIGAELVRGFEMQPNKFVFLNACEIGQGHEDLGSYSGMGPAFLKQGACAVVAPLWSVTDKGAHGVAERFYERVFAGMSPAEALRHERAQAHSSKSVDSLSYLYFGHPLLRIELSTP